jgi:creatinine amidohydrolase
MFEITPASWAGKPYREITAVGESDGSVAVVPVGSVEQHGHHLPVATDTLLADAVARLGAERVGDDVPLLVTPPVWTGNSPHHLPFGGTISVGVRCLLDVLERVADGVLANGFDALLFLNGHGGNASTIDDAVSVVGDAHPEAEVLGLTYFELAASFVHEVRESDTGGMAHAGEFETSLLLHLRPDLVDEDAIEGTPMDEPYERDGRDLLESGPLSVYRTFEEYSASGAVGDPHLATAETGAAIYERLGDELEDLLATIHARNRGRS